MPIQRRLPKRGFKNIHREEFKVFNIGQVDQLAEKYELKEFSLETLYINKLISRTDKVKILGNGEMKSTIPFKVHAASAKAQEQIKNAGGSIEIVK